MIPILTSLLETSRSLLGRLIPPVATDSSSSAPPEASIPSDPIPEEAPSSEQVLNSEAEAPEANQESHNEQNEQSTGNVRYQIVSLSLLMPSAHFEEGQTDQLREQIVRHFEASLRRAQASRNTSSAEYSSDSTENNSTPNQTSGVRTSARLAERRAENVSAFADQSPNSTRVRSSVRIFERNAENGTSDSNNDEAESNSISSRMRSMSDAIRSFEQITENNQGNVTEAHSMARQARTRAMQNLERARAESIARGQHIDNSNPFLSLAQEQQESVDPDLSGDFFRAFFDIPRLSRQNAIRVVPATTFSSIDQAIDFVFAQLSRRVHLQGQPPASSSAMESLPRFTVTEQQPDEEPCPVCQEAKSENCIKMPCNHTYHEECLLTWLKCSNTCPVCRFEIGTDNEEYNEGVLRRMRERESANDRGIKRKRDDTSDDGGGQESVV